MSLTQLRNLGIVANAGITTTKLGTGAVLQIVSATYSTSTTTTSTSYVDSGLTASITPSSISNKVLIIFSTTGILTQAINTAVTLGLHKSSTLLYEPMQYIGYDSASNDNQRAVSGVYLDSPSSTSSLAYNIKFKRISGSISVGVQANSSTSTIALLEIKG